MSNVTAPRFEDVEVGDRIPDMWKGPLTTAHLMRWSAAMENWHKIHYDRDFAINHDKLPDLLINGSLKQQFFFQSLKDWVGETGWVWKISFQFRAMNKVGEKLQIWGKVTRKQAYTEFGMVFLDLGTMNEAGMESTPGKAIVALPYRDGAPVPYPFTLPSGADDLSA